MDKKFYIGVKIIEAWPEEKDGKEGYGVQYPDGYKSWSPKDVFESAYLEMGPDPSKVTINMVTGFIKEFVTQTLEDGKTLFARAELLTGFTQYEASSCVDPQNYDEKIGSDICLRRVKDNIWQWLGFVVQWGRFGLKR